MLLTGWGGGPNGQLPRRANAGWQTLTDAPAGIGFDFRFPRDFVDEFRRSLYYLRLNMLRGCVANPFDSAHETLIWVCLKAKKDLAEAEDGDVHARKKRKT